MDSTLAPDPFAALNLPSNATSADIKSAYRKLALKCHPDKVADEALKKIKQEEFHKIQQAYELIGDDERLEAYRAEVRLEAQRKAKFASRAASGPSAARYDVRTAAPAGTGAPYSTAAPHRYEERKPTASRSFEDDYYKTRSKTYDTYDPYPKQSSSSRTARPEKESIRPTRVSADRSRSERNKTRDKEERRSRSDKFAHLDEEPSSNDEKVRFEATFRKNSEDARVRDGAADSRKKADEARKKSESRRSYEEREAIKEPRHQRSDDRELDHRKSHDISDKEAAARAHIAQMRKTTGITEGPSPSRITSRDVPHESTHDSSRSRRDRPETVRRSSARPRDRERSDRSAPEIVDWDNGYSPPKHASANTMEYMDRPSFQKSNSSPADIKIPQRAAPIRAYTDAPSRRVDKSPIPTMRRSDTAPSHMSSSRNQDYAPRPSNLRSSEYLPHSSSPPEGGHTSTLHAQPSKKYYYAEGPTARESHRRTRSPEPVSRPPIGLNRSPEAPAPPRSHRNTPPQLTRAQTSVFPDGDRGRRLFNEITPEHRRTDRHYSPEKNAPYSRKFGPDNISYSSHRGSSRDPYKPNLGRSAPVNAY